MYKSLVHLASLECLAQYKTLHLDNQVKYSYPKYVYASYTLIFLHDNFIKFHGLPNFRLSLLILQE